MDSMAMYAKCAALMWLTGFREACCVHRAVLFCIRSRALSIWTGQILLLNGLIFLGSLSVLSSIVIPILLWILPSKCGQFGSQLCDHEAAMSFYSSLRFLLIVLFYVLWFWPLCFLCYLLGSIWYGDIVKHAFDIVRGQGSSLEPQNHVQMGRPVGFEGYKWDHSELSLDERLDLFESNWGFLCRAWKSLCSCGLLCFWISELGCSGYSFSIVCFDSGRHQSRTTGFFKKVTWSTWKVSDILYCK